MSAIKSIFNGAIDSITTGFQQNPIGYINDTVSGISNIYTGVKNFGGSSFGSGIGGTISIPTGTNSGPIIITKDTNPVSSGFGIDFSNPLVLGIGALILAKVLKIF